MLPVLLLLLASSGVAIQPKSPAPAAAADPAFAAWAAELEAGLNAGEAAALDARLDDKALLDRASQGVQAPAAFFTGLRDGLKRSGSLAPGKNLVEALEPEVGAKVLRTRLVQGKPHTLLRLNMKDDGVNYWDLELRKDADGKVRVLDIYVYAMGETLSATLHRVIQLAAADAQLGLVDRALGKEALFLKTAPDMKAMKQAVSAGKPEEALAIYARMPPSIQSERPMLMLRLTAASSFVTQEGDPRYAQAIAAFEKAFPGDPALDLVSLDGYVLRKDFAGALRAVDRLDQRVQDPYLSVLRGNFALEQDDAAGARKHFLAALAREPAMRDAHYSLIGLALQQEDWKELAARLTVAERDAGVAFDGVEEAEGFAPFVKTKEFRAWKKAREAARAAQDVE